jgi:hypothetical protein
MGWWFVILGPVVAIIGVWVAARPRQAGMLFQGWKYVGPDEVELSDAYVALIRLGGLFKVVLGVVLTIVGIVDLMAASPAS